MEMRATRDIERPAAKVFEFFADASNNPSWQNGMRSCVWTSVPPIGEGSTYEQHARFIGRDIRTTFVVTTYEPGRRIAIASVESTFPISVERSVTPIDADSCRVSAVITGGPQGRLAKLAAPLVGRLAQRSVDGDYDRLVQFLQAGTGT